MQHVTDIDDVLEGDRVGNPVVVLDNLLLLFRIVLGKDPLAAKGGSKPSKVRKYSQVDSRHGKSIK
jgi:hypothetical protein